MTPDSNRMTTDDWSDVPIGVKPDGGLILSFSDLPQLPIPSRVVVGRSFIDIDGWLIAYPDMRKGTLNWFRDRFLAWREVDPEEANRAWIMGMADALHDALLGRD
jgi:hypothetical protein